MAKKFKVVAHLPGSIELTKRKSQNALKIDVKMGDSKEGTLVIARGTVEWWPERNKVNAHRGDWEKFAEILEKYLPQRRSTRERQPVESAAERRERKAKKRAAAKKARATIRKKKAAARRS
jgi:hypothetical protein